jgi:hypothetical protein
MAESLAEKHQVYDPDKSIADILGKDRSLSGLGGKAYLAPLNKYFFFSLRPILVVLFLVVTTWNNRLKYVV